MGENADVTRLGGTSIFGVADLGTGAVRLYSMEYGHIGPGNGD
jgi:hypothetical protein